MSKEKKLQTVSAIKADWSREDLTRFWEPGRKLLKSIRNYQKYKQQTGIIALILSKVAVFQYRFWTIITGADIPVNCQLGGGLLIPHPNGIVIHPGAKVGINCLIHQQVTIGVKRGSDKPPVIGAYVDIGAGAKLIGNINIGNNALIGANAVVVKDVEAGMTVAGIPAKVIGRTE